VKHEFAKELYFRELDRRVQLDGAPSFRVIAIGLIAGLFTQYFKVYSGAGLPAPRVLVALAGAASICCGGADIQIVRSYLGYDWQILAPAQQLLGYYYELQHYRDAYGEESDPDADSTFADYLRLRMVEAASANNSNNNTRSERLYSASRLIAFAVGAALLGGAVLAVDYLRLSALH
jgi:hypothetical protein